VRRKERPDFPEETPDEAARGASATRIGAVSGDYLGSICAIPRGVAGTGSLHFVNDRVDGRRGGESGDAVLQAAGEIMDISSYP
jgi:hypothetical protein